MKAITSGDTHSTKGSGRSKGKAPALPKGKRGKEKEREMTVLRLLHLHQMAKEVSRERVIQKLSLQ